jgi:hypothetical protein
MVMVLPCSQSVVGVSGLMLGTGETDFTNEPGGAVHWARTVATRTRTVPVVSLLTIHLQKKAPIDPFFERFIRRPTSSPGIKQIPK